MRVKKRRGFPMNPLQKLRLILRALLRKRNLDAQMDEELRAHIEMQTQKNLKEGMTIERARAAALRQFGRIDSVKETCREQRGIAWLEQFMQDIRFGLRRLGKNPGLAFVAILTLALGIGANTAIFSLVNAVMLRPPPFPESQRLVFVSEKSRHMDD